MSSTPLNPDAAASAGQIDFPCGGCGRMLKVPAGSTGRQAKCPQCGSVQQVPDSAPPNAPTTDNAATTTDLTPAGSAAGNPIGVPTDSNPPAPQQPAASPTPAGLQPNPQFARQTPGENGITFTTPVAPSPTPASQPTSAPIPVTASLTPEAPAPPQSGARDTPTKQLFDRITEQIGKIYVGQDELVLGALVALFSSGHVLIESVPGLGKTLFVRTLGKVLGCSFGRIQFTADLMPSDITGAPIFDMKQQEFRFRPGPVFTQLLLADEINRSPAKTHAALLEIMQEFRVTIDGQSHTIERPFLVLATQNPIESEGTYNLPEAQLDRFMFKLVADYPQEHEEAEILKLHSMQTDINERLETELETITSPKEILETTKLNGDVHIDDRLIDYINKIVRLTRGWPQLHMGASPRAGLALMQAARTLAAFAGRDYAVPDDVVQIALPALRHRVILTAEAEVEGHRVDDLLTELIRSVEVPPTVTEWFQEHAALLQSLPWITLAVIAVPFVVLTRWRISPHTPLLIAILAPCLLVFGVLINSDVLMFVLIADVLIVVVAAVDLLTIPNAQTFTVERKCMRVASLKMPHQVTLGITNQSGRTLTVWIRDDLPDQFRVDPRQFHLRLAGRSRASFDYEFKSQRRGSYTLENVYIQVRSMFGLWKRHLVYPCTSVIHVYPDMKQLAEYAVLARTNRLSLMGVRRTRKIGQDNEFERLRDYTPDDNYKHIDWRTTARRNKLTVKDFQTSQSQRIIFLLDCGRMMTNEASELSLLDHSLNAMLMLSFVALRQGDAVGLISFSDTIHNYIPPRGGMSQMNQLLHASFDRFPKLVESRYDQAFLYLASHCAKRSLVVLISNVIDEVNSHQIEQYLTQLVGRHLPLGVLLRDHQLFDAAEHPHPQGQDLFRAAAAAEILTWRHQVLTDLEHKGVLALDVFPEDMTAPLVNSYLEIKARHLL